MDATPLSAAPTRRSPRAIGAPLAALAAAALGLALLALCLHPALRFVGAMLVEESALEPVDVLVVSSSTGVADAFEAARLQRAGYARQVLIPGTTVADYTEQLRRLGIAYPSQTELMEAVLARSGVPDAAIRTLPAEVDGTQSEVAATAGFIAAARPATVMVVTARSHSARTAWLLRREVPSATRVLVRSPRDDTFDPASWWHSRWQVREVISECLRWFNTVIGDLWRPRIRHR